MNPDAQSVPCQPVSLYQPPYSRSLIIAASFTDTLFPRNGEIGCPHPGMEEIGISFFWCSYMNPAGILGSPPGQSLLLAWLAPSWTLCSNSLRTVCLNSVMTTPVTIIMTRGRRSSCQYAVRKTETNTRCPLWGLLWFGAFPPVSSSFLRVFYRLFTSYLLITLTHHLCENLCLALTPCFLYVHHSWIFFFPCSRQHSS